MLTLVLSPNRQYGDVRKSPNCYRPPVSGLALLAAGANTVSYESTRSKRSLPGRRSERKDSALPRPWLTDNLPMLLTERPQDWPFEFTRTAGDCLPRAIVLRNVRLDESTMRQPDMTAMQALAFPKQNLVGRE